MLRFHMAISVRNLSTYRYCSDNCRLQSFIHRIEQRIYSLGETCGGSASGCYFSTAFPQYTSPAAAAPRIMPSCLHSRIARPTAARIRSGGTAALAAAVTVALRATTQHLSALATAHALTPIHQPHHRRPHRPSTEPTARKSTSTAKISSTTHLRQSILRQRIPGTYCPTLLGGKAIPGAQTSCIGGAILTISARRCAMFLRLEVSLSHHQEPILFMLA